MYQPDYTAALGLIQHLSNDELKEILNDDDKFENIMKDIKQLKDWETEKEMLIAENRSLAEYNLSKEPELTELKRIIAQKSERGEELCKSVQTKLDELKSKSSAVSLDTTLALLEASTAEAEEESEDIAQKFVSGEHDMEKFLEDFTKARNLMHLRKVKVDKMGELMRNKQNQPPMTGAGSMFGASQPAQPPYPTPYPPSSHSFYPPPSGMPYPTGGFNMPMPGGYRNY